MITKDELVKDLIKFGIENKRVIVHSSLSSIGRVIGGSTTVIEALTEVCKTVMMPAFCWDSVTHPPLGDYPNNNGCNYSYYDNWDRMSKPFIIDKMGVEKSLGVIAKEFVKFPGVDRSNHSWHSWAVFGEDSRNLVENHSWSDTNTPISKLLKFEDSFILMIGVTFSSCTAIHVAEEIVGREPFIRWVIDKDGNNKRVSVSGCGNGFWKIEKPCKENIKKELIGKSPSMLIKLDKLISCAKNAMLEYPEITKCSDECIRCKDTIKNYERKGKNNDC